MDLAYSANMIRSLKIYYYSKMKDTKRSALKKIVGSGAIVSLAPSIWTKPIINSLVLPAHAQTSSQLRADATFMREVSCSSGSFSSSIGVTATPTSYIIADGIGSLIIDLSLSEGFDTGGVPIQTTVFLTVNVLGEQFVIELYSVAGGRCNVDLFDRYVVEQIMTIDGVDSMVTVEFLPLDDMRRLAVSIRVREV
ncbi:MAG: hypothetical protein ACRBHB_19435 [Arenicella sp.]